MKVNAHKNWGEVSELCLIVRTKNVAPAATTGTVIGVHFKQDVLYYMLYPTNPFTILEPRDQEIGQFYVVQKRHAVDFKAPKL